jgi:hypothetical protein
MFPGLSPAPKEFAPMRSCWIGFAAVSVTTGLAYLAVAGGAEGPILPPNELKRLVSQEAKVVQETLAKGFDPKDKKGPRKVRAAAFMIAAYAQSGMNKENAAHMASLRDAALNVVKAVEDGKVDEAKKLAAELAPESKAKAGAKTGPVPLAKSLEFDVLMRIFSSERIGGFGLENELDELPNTKGWTPEQLDKLTGFAYKLAVVGEVAHGYVPEKDEGGQKTRKNWNAYSSQLRDSSLALAAAAKAKKEGDISASLNKVASSCKKCHDVFRDN